MANNDLTLSEFIYVLQIAQLQVKLGHRGATAALKALESAYKVDDEAVRKI